MRLLLDSGASASITDNDGDTPLHVCSTVNCATLLLQRGGQSLLSARNEDGKTALECYQEELEEARMQALGEQMVTLNGNTTTAEMDAMMQQVSQETSAEVERLQAIVDMLSQRTTLDKEELQSDLGGVDPVPSEEDKDGGEEKPPPSP